MNRTRHRRYGILLLLLLPLLALRPLAAGAELRENIYNLGQLPPVNTQSPLKVGDPAPDFTLPALDGSMVTLSDFRGKKNVVLSFVPAAWTPICSDQWPGYNILADEFAALDTVLLGITVDNLPTLHAWVNEMGGLWFPVLSDFWPHGAVAQAYGILRPEGVSERALFIVDKAGVLRHVGIGDINLRPELGQLMQALRGVAKGE